jgi:hypothetical protein
MYDSTDTAQVPKTERGWLLLIHQIPPKPDYFRVKVRRQLQRLGAVPLKNSVYVLPNTDETVEDFQWLRRSVIEDGGEATICNAAFVEGISDQEMESLFRAWANAEYEELLQAAATVRVAPTDVDVRRLQRQLATIKARDYFEANQGREATRTVQDIANSLVQRRDALASSDAGGPVPRGATWVTRSGVHVDRMASAWLIQRFIDPLAQFKFVPAKGYKPNPGELRFDMFEGEYTHQGGRCTFEVLQASFRENDSALRTIGEIVHDIDCKDDRYGRDETTGVATLVHGIILTQSDDAACLAAAANLFDGLYASLQRKRT